MACYFAKNKKSSKQAPCNHTALDNGGHTQCCEPGDLCLTNSLCREEYVNDSTNYAWRFGCTDPAFEDPACGTRYCDAKPGLAGIDGKLTWKCPEDSLWCCNTGDSGPQENRINNTNETCCTILDLQFTALNPDVFTIASFYGSAFLPATLATTTGVGNGTTRTATATAQTATFMSTTASSTASATPAAATGPSPTAIGLGAGLGSFAAIALGIGSFFIWRRRKRASQERSTSPAPVKELSDHGVAEAGSQIRAEMTGMEYRREIGSPVSPVELWSPTSPAECVELPTEEKGRLVVNEIDGRQRHHA